METISTVKQAVTKIYLASPYTHPDMAVKIAVLAKKKVVLHES